MVCVGMKPAVSGGLKKAMPFWNVYGTPLVNITGPGDTLGSAAREKASLYHHWSLIRKGINGLVGARLQLQCGISSALGMYETTVLHQAMNMIKRNKMQLNKQCSTLTVAR